MFPAEVVVLGPQRTDPTVQDAIAGLQAHVPEGARIAVVTCGWEEREGDDEELVEHLGGNVVNLSLFARAEDSFRHDPELLAKLLEHHGRLGKLQRLYRLRLAASLDAARTLLRREVPDDDPELVEISRREAIADVRRLDDQHFQRIRDLHAGFQAEWKPTERDVIARHRGELEAILSDCGALCIAGGHVQILLNRLRLFGLTSLLGDRPVLAWSAGAMALAERVIVFHDSPPQGRGNAEVLEAGLGLLPGLVPLPHASRRLRLDDPIRVGLFARRFGPALCAALDQGAKLAWDGRRWTPGDGTRHLTIEGSVEALPA
jgi:hypothetical protein